MDDHIVACDIGGSVTRVGVAGTDCHVRQILRTPTPMSSSELVREISTLSALAARRVGWDPSNAIGIGVAVPAAVDPKDNSIGSCGNLPSISGFSFSRAMRETSGIPVVLENDANAAALGELLQGGAIGESNFVLIVVGTGVGMGAVVDGHLLRGATGAAGELGYISFDQDPLDIGGQEPGALHRSISGSEISHFADSIRGSYPDTRVGPGASPAEIFYAAEANDPLGRAVLINTTRHLSRALLAVVTLLNPSLVLFGGGVGSNPVLVASVRQCMMDFMTNPPAIRAAKLADRAGIVGAAALALAVANGVPSDLGITPEALEALIHGRTQGHGDTIISLTRSNRKSV